MTIAIGGAVADEKQAKDDLAPIAPHLGGELILARTPTEGELIAFIDNYIRRSDKKLVKAVAIYLSDDTLTPLSRLIKVTTDDNGDVPVAYFSRTSTSASGGIAFLLLTPETEEVEKELRVNLLQLEFDAKRQRWLAQGHPETVGP